MPMSTCKALASSITGILDPRPNARASCMTAACKSVVGCTGTAAGAGDSVGQDTSTDTEQPAPQEG